VTHRWFTENDDTHSQWYADHFRELAAEGADIEGEARFIDALVNPGSRILDAGCGQGRTAGALVQRGHHVVAVDVDATLLTAARGDHPGPTYIECDLVELDLRDDRGERMTFDAAVSAGNVITFVTPGTEVGVLRTIRSHLQPDAPCVIGFHTERYAVEDFDRDVSAAGFILESRFATWHLRPWHDDADFAVSVLRNPLVD
jgi:cyclopropane fatty-acyl-phospholipid synthase-like methyltransferase